MPTSLRAFVFAALLASRLFAEDAPVEKPFHVDIRHTAAECAARAKGEACDAAEHWEFAVAGNALDEEKLRKALKEEAGKGMDASERVVEIGGPPDAPWGRVQAAMMSCAECRIYRIQWLPAAAGDKAEPFPTWLPKSKAVGEDPVPNPILEEVRVFLKKNAKGGIARKVNAQVVEKDEDLATTLVERIEKFRSLGKPETPVVIDAAADVPWSAVIRVGEICREKKLEHVEFVAPMPGTK